MKEKLPLHVKKNVKVIKPIRIDEDSFANGKFPLVNTNIKIEVNFTEQQVLEYEEKHHLVEQTKSQDEDNNISFNTIMKTGSSFIQKAQFMIISVSRIITTKTGNYQIVNIVYPASFTIFFLGQKGSYLVSV